MSGDQAKIEKAAEILKAHRVGEIAESLLNEGFRFSSMPTVAFERYAKRDYIDDSGTGVLMKHDGHELVVATTEFRSSAAPDDPDFYANGLIYFDVDRVLKVTATKTYDEYGSTIRFSIYPHAIKSMRAGPWLEMLSTCHDILKNDHQQREKTARAESDRKQASDIDLGDY